MTRQASEDSNAENDRELAWLALDALPLQTAVLDRDGNIIQVNAAWRRFARENAARPGLAAARTGVGTNYVAICDAATGYSYEGSARAAEGIRAVLSGERPDFGMEYPCHAPDRQRWFLMTVAPLAGGVGAVVAHIDITQRKLDERRLQLALDATGDGLWDWDVANDRAYLSPSYFALAGYLPEDVTANLDFFRRLVHPDDWPGVFAIMGAHLRGESPFSELEYRMITADGATRWIRCRGRVMERADDGAPLRMAGLIMDISEDKRVEQTLRESEERYRAVLEDQTEVISRLRVDGTFIYVNEVYCRFFGLCPEDLIGQKWMPICHPLDLPRVLDELRALAPDNPVVVIENRVYAGTGELHWMQFVNRGFFDAQGQLYEIQSVGRDIGARKKAEAELHAVLAQLEQRIAERTEEVRRLTVETTLAEERERQAIARDLHDDLGQRLHVMRLKLDGLLKACPDSAAPVAELRDLVGEASLVVRSLTSQLSPPVLMKLGLSAALVWLAEEMTRRYGLSVEFCQDGDMPALTEVQTAILFRSARELLINVVKHAGTNQARLDLVRADGQLSLAVADAGRGLAAADTLEAGGGFGLASLRERMAFLGGRFGLETPPGGGLRVSLVLPVGEASEPAP